MTLKCTPNTKKSFKAGKIYFFQNCWQHVSRGNFLPATRCTHLERTKIKFSLQKSLPKVTWGVPAFASIWSYIENYYRKFTTNGTLKKSFKEAKKHFFQNCRQHVSKGIFLLATRCACLKRTKIKFSSRKSLSKVIGVPSIWSYIENYYREFSTNGTLKKNIL